MLAINDIPRKGGTEADRAASRARAGREAPGVARWSFARPLSVLAAGHFAVFEYTVGGGIASTRPGPRGRWRPRKPLPPDPDPLEDSVPAIVMSDPSLAQVRHVLTSIGRGRVPGTALEDLMFGVGEAVSNARRHGGPPVTARIWAGSGRIVVHVHDTGPGPADPLAGLVPVWARPGRRRGGLWLMHMLDLNATLIRSRDGFTVRLAAGRAA